MKKLILTVVICLLSLYSFSQTATYDIVFTSNWAAHGPLPGNAHFTELVGATHNSNATFFEMSGMATPGVKRVAELGLFNIFNNEVNGVITANNADQFISGPNLFPSPTNLTITISDLQVSSDYPLISLISMIAPSPDWMIAMNSISLVDGGGEWIPEITMDIYPYDAGTEEGTGYSLNNPETNPQETITSIQGVAPFNSEPVGTIVFTQKNLSTPSFDARKDAFTMSPNPSGGEIKITSASNTSFIEIYNVLGKRVKYFDFGNSPTTKNMDLDLSSLNAGIFLVRVHNSIGKVQTQKLIIR